MIVNALIEADSKLYSYQCPYLALADVLGYITPQCIHALPSRFGRISTKRMLLNYEVGIAKASMIWKMLEHGYTLKEIAEKIRSDEYD